MIAFAYLFGVFILKKKKFWNPTYILTRFKLKFGKCSKLEFQKLNNLLKNNQVVFFDYMIIFQSTKMLAHIADLRLCALMPLPPYVLEPL